MDAAGVIAYYVMDGNRPLTATTGSDTTSYLYGLGVIGEESNAWSYGLTDGTNTQRQLTDALGEVTYSARYTPWGDTLESYGSGTFAFGYFGGLMDAATGLLYVGDGQYYDPSTGRFLTRGARPNSPNPYLPFDPTGALFLPLALVSLVYGRKRRKSKWDILVIVTLLSLSVGMGVAACGGSGTPTLPAGSTVTAVVTPISSNTAAVAATVDSTPVPTFTATVPPNTSVEEVLEDICTEVPLPVPAPSTIDEELSTIYRVFLEDGKNGKWPEAYKLYVLSAVKKLNEKLPFAAVFGGLKFIWGCPHCLGFAIVSSDKIEFRKFFSVPDTNPKFIIHELGHAFDHKVCAAWNGRSCGDNINTLSPIRSRLKEDVATMRFLYRDGYGKASDDTPFSGFAGGENDWQFALSWQTDFSLYKGEVWADMFLGWAYGNLATDRMNYMNNVMPEYLSLFNCK
jgi:RHS repeat-associated protein